MEKCYMCDDVGVTKEHAPPYSFFPKGYREKLWTVPSCDEHNSKNSLDVEYVRNILTTHLATEGSKANHLYDTVLKSFKNSPKLLARTFADARPVIIGGQETGVFSLDLQRFKRVMEAIAYAIYYRMHGKTYADSWTIFSPILVSKSTFFQGRPDGWEQFRQVLSQIRFAEVPTPQPEIFRLGIHQWNEAQLIYYFEFYGGFTVTALAGLEEPNRTTQV